MTVKYVHNNQGHQEAVIIPIHLWRMIQPYLPTITKAEIAKKEKLNFDPTQYFGILSELNLDTEEELVTIRAEWNSGF